MEKVKTKPNVSKVVIRDPDRAKAMLRQHLRTAPEGSFVMINKSRAKWASVAMIEELLKRNQENYPDKGWLGRTLQSTPGVESLRVKIEKKDVTLYRIASR